MKINHVYEGHNDYIKNYALKIVELATFSNLRERNRFLQTLEYQADLGANADITFNLQANFDDIKKEKRIGNYIIDKAQIFKYSAMAVNLLFHILSDEFVAKEDFFEVNAPSSIPTTTVCNGRFAPIDRCEGKRNNENCYERQSNNIRRGLKDHILISYRRVLYKREK